MTDSESLSVMTTTAVDMRGESSSAFVSGIRCEAGSSSAAITSSALDVQDVPKLSRTENLVGKRYVSTLALKFHLFFQQPWCPLRTARKSGDEHGVHRPHRGSRLCWQCPTRACSFTCEAEGIAVDCLQVLQHERHASNCPTLFKQQKEDSHTEKSRACALTVPEL